MNLFYSFLSAEVSDVVESTTLEGTKINIGEALLVLLICMAVIMGILLVLMGILYLFKFIPKVEQKIDDRKAAKDALSASETQPQLEQPAVASDEDDSAEIAAVVAAVTQVLNQTTQPLEDGSAPFRIKTVRRKR